MKIQLKPVGGQVMRQHERSAPHHRRQ